MAPSSRLHQEIVSPGSRQINYFTKTALYSDAGVKEYWIIDPKKERTIVYHYEDDEICTIYPFSSPIFVGLYPELVIKITDLLDNSLI